MLNQKKLDWILALAVLLISGGFYFATMAPTFSFWDCGELIASAFTLGNPHPPGNPLLLLLWRAFIVVLPFQEVAARTNFLSVVTSAAVAMLAFLIVIKSLRMIFARGGLSPVALYAGGLVGAFLAGFSDTHWFSAVETETGGPSMLFVMLVTWLALHWWENRGTGLADRILILITYLAFLGVGVHLFSFITMPVFALLLLADKESRSNVPLLVTGALLFSIVYAVGSFIFLAAGTLLVCVIALFSAKSPTWRRRWSLSAWLALVALLGFSTYLYVPIRSSVNVSIDEGEPSDFKQYLKFWEGKPTAFRDYIERKQYGSESMIKRAFHRRGAWNNQVLVHPHMGFGGYLLAQYFPWKVGDADENEPVIRHIGSAEIKFPAMYESLRGKVGTQMFLFLLLQIPFLWGGYLAYKRNRSVGAYLLALFVVTSYGLVFYLNFADGTRMELRDFQAWVEAGRDSSNMPPPVYMEVRERDYFYTPGFIFMGVLFGISTAFLLNWLAARARHAAKPVAAVLVTLSLVVPVWSNYKEHDRSGVYVPWDYAYNLLNSCRPNAILFTNGDNDTFPLWFLQEVEGVRKDVRVVNLSLVNTNWYMHQLLDHEPALKLGFTHEQIDQLQPQPWRFNGPVEISIPNTSIRYVLQPLPYLRVQDIMVLNLVQNNFPERPVHFAVTIGGDNAMGLDQFTIMEGMVYTLVQEPKNREIDVAATARLVDSVYRFRGLGDPKVHIDKNTEGLLTNYSATNFRLASWAQDSLQKIMPRLTELRAAGASPERAALEARASELLAFAERYLNLNAQILPNEWRVHYYAGQLYLQAGDKAKADSAFRKGLAVKNPNARVFAMSLAQLYLQDNRTTDARKVLEEARERFPEDLELAFALAEVYRQLGDIGSAGKVLSEWLAANPKHEYAPQVAAQLQQLQSMPAGVPGQQP